MKLLVKQTMSERSSEFPKDFLKIDEEGFWVEDGFRIQDSEEGAFLLSQLFMDSSGRAFTRHHDKIVAVEFFDTPLVAHSLIFEGDQIWAVMPYGFKKQFLLTHLVSDEWDRFISYTETGLPIVLRRSAQETFFSMIEDFDDTSVTWKGQKFTLQPLFFSGPQVEGSEFWSHIYQTEKPGWDLQRESVILPDVLPQLKLPHSKIVVLGCGAGHDAAFWAQAGHLVTGVDFSGEAISLAHKNYGHMKNLQFVQADLFALPRSFCESFDVVFEHTCYCAVAPYQRSNLVQVWKRLLVDQGHLLGIFFSREKRTGPPWGSHEWEIRQRLQKSFHFRYWTRWRRSIETRQGSELVVWAQKKSFGEG